MKDEQTGRKAEREIDTVSRFQIVVALYHKLKQSCALKDGRNYRPKHVELIEIINKLLLLHLVGCLYYYISDAWSHKHQIA